LVADDQSSLPDYSASASREGESIPAPATLEALLGRAPGAEEVANAMFEAVRTLEDPDATELPEDEVRRDALERVPHFVNEDWTWRR
ncbi:MAG TPA: hypothetical protein VN797_09520, partial [Gemmatimonadaceae bacterium]|nr:hypothetical protein [Gemmatimonadaceae bacterium]